MPALCRPDIVAILRSAGIESGDTLLVHSSFKSIGPVDGGADTLIDALLEAIGPNGHLAMPAFNYSPAPEPFFDPDSCPSRTGIVTELFRKRPGVCRSLHPTHSVAVAGPQARVFTDNHITSGACGIDSPIDQLAQAGGKVMLIGVTQQANTTIHVGETRAGIARFPAWDGEAPVAQVRLPDGTLAPCTLDTTNSCSAAFNGVEQFLRAHGWIRDFRFGSALSQVMLARHVIDAVAECHAAFPTLLFCTNPACKRCSRARSAAAQSI